MSDTHKIQLVRGRGAVVGDVATALIFIALTYYSFNPDALERHLTSVQKRCDLFIHRMSVWQAFQAIRDLPETDEPAS